MEVRIAGTVNDSIVDGPGLRFVILLRDAHIIVRAVIIHRHMHLMLGKLSV